ncbi:hypothetical protein SeMB42_g01476 [Synchytrium endobioticum]|uniref:CFA20 domain-containing protein n=1 Tax=Synchytrium endobioticum TaxID=286115 RepID=A0A507DKY2_9FUNG|nr:hypothetical protein SeLEV6574_g01197 [Synchytrium endobioticum]TPX52359.1 hypothetical protein SeMB42_g01476 [Synchytrium endobioticum]
MLLFKNGYQGGVSFDVLDVKSPDHWKLSKVEKVYERESKGYILATKGHGAAGIPKDPAKQFAHLVQPYLIFQIWVPLAAPLTLEMSIADVHGHRHKFLLSAAYRALQITPLHVSIPLSEDLPRNTWLNLVIDCASLITETVRGSSYRTLDSIAVAGGFKLRRVFTVREKPFEVDQYGEFTEPIPRSHQYPPGVEFASHLICLSRSSSEPPPSIKRQQNEPTFQDSKSHIAFGRKAPALSPLTKTSPDRFPAPNRHASISNIKTNLGQANHSHDHDDHYQKQKQQQQQQQQHPPSRSMSRTSIQSRQPPAQSTSAHIPMKPAPSKEPVGSAPKIRHPKANTASTSASTRQTKSFTHEIMITSEPTGQIPEASATSPQIALPSFSAYNPSVYTDDVEFVPPDELHADSDVDNGALAFPVHNTSTSTISRPISASASAQSNRAPKSQIPRTKRASPKTASPQISSAQTASPRSKSSSDPSFFGEHGTKPEPTQRPLTEEAEVFKPSEKTSDLKDILDVLDTIIQEDYGVPSEADHVINDGVPSGADQVINDGVPSEADHVINDGVPSGADQVINDGVLSEADHVINDGVPSEADHVINDVVARAAESQRAESRPSAAASTHDGRLVAQSVEVWQHLASEEHKRPLTAELKASQSLVHSHKMVSNGTMGVESHPATAAAQLVDEQGRALFEQDDDGAEEIELVYDPVRKVYTDSYGSVYEIV